VRPEGDARELAAHLAAAGIPARAGYLEEPLNRAPLWDRPVYGSARYPLDGYVPNPCPEAERLVAETLLIIDWNENYTAEHADAVAREITRFTAS
jgi:hypothetical protein